MRHAYNEDHLVEQPAIGLFGALGWQTVLALEDVFVSISTLGASLEHERRWYECLYLGWLTQRLVRMDQVLRPVVKALP